MSSLQYETKSWPFIDDEITIGRPVLILDQINACENKGGINHCAIATRATKWRSMEPHSRLFLQ